MEFSERMQALLGDEYEQFLQYYNGDNFRGLRVNTLKCTAQQLQAALSCSLQPTPFCPDGYYLPEELTGNHPLHHAGAFYIQEPSATSAVEMLGVQPGEQVLDLCAAPGGKSTQIAAKLQGKGLLWSNEIVKSRANILLSNIERMGVRNAVVSNCHPETLCAALSGQFDRVLVDAPCSGEGMFRKNSDAKTEWSAEHVRSCAERQLHILNSAKTALKPGGVLVYSTCTFSREENESVIARFLADDPDFEPEDAQVSFGRPTENFARRIFPMDGGEGHFAARLRKKGDRVPSAAAVPGAKADEEVLRRAGVILGEIVKKRIEPHHSAFMAAKPQDCRQCVPLDCNSDAARAYLHGEEIAADAALRGYAAVAVNGVTAGFGKASGGRLKNKYPKGLRTLK